MVDLNTRYKIRRREKILNIMMIAAIVSFVLGNIFSIITADFLGTLLGSVLAVFCVFVAMFYELLA
jgi:uncharacterized membrane protein YccC